VAKERVGAVIEVWAYADDESGKEWGYVIAPWNPDKGGVPFSSVEKCLEAVANELPRAFREAAALRKKRAA